MVHTSEPERWTGAAGKREITQREESVRRVHGMICIVQSAPAEI